LWRESMESILTLDLCSEGRDFWRRHWSLNGLVQGLKNRQPFWFTAHIGTARDLNS
jgi:hypothetical protein